MSGARLIGVAVAAPFILAVVGAAAWWAGHNLWTQPLKGVAPKPAVELSPIPLSVGDDGE